MSSFTNALIVKKQYKQLWEVNEPFTYEVGVLGSGEKITVPKGYISDLASVPRFLWTFFPHDDNYSQAAVLHDWLCDKRGGCRKKIYTKTSFLYF